MRPSLGACLGLLALLLCLAGEAAAHYVRLDEELVTKGTLTVGLGLSGRPFAYREGGELKGFEVEMARAVAEAHGLTLEIKQLPRAKLRAALEAGEVDAINTLPLKEAAQAEGLALLPYLAVGNHMLVLKGNPFRIFGAEDLGGRTVAVTGGTSAEVFARALSDDLQAAGHSKMRIHSFPNHRHTHIPVSMGHAAAYFVHTVSAIATTRDPESRMMLVEGVFQAEREIGLAVRRKGSNIHHAIEHAIAAAVATGKYDRIVREASLPPDLSAFKK